MLILSLNDGAHLVRTVGDLASLYPTAQSIAIVPLGLTKSSLPSLRPLSPSEEAQVIRLVSAWQCEFRRDLGVGFVHL